MAFIVKALQPLAFTSFSDTSPLDSTLLQLKLPACPSPLSSASVSTESTEMVLLIEAAEEARSISLISELSHSPLCLQELTFLLLWWRQVLRGRLRLQQPVRRSLRTPSGGRNREQQVSERGGSLMKDLQEYQKILI